LEKQAVCSSDRQEKKGVGRGKTNRALRTAVFLTVGKRRLKKEATTRLEEGWQGLKRRGKKRKQQRKEERNGPLPWSRIVPKGRGGRSEKKN